MEETWIGSTAVSHRQKRLFEIGIWNTRTHTDEDVPRTTKLWGKRHRTFEGRISVKHPSAERLAEKKIKLSTLVGS